MRGARRDRDLLDPKSLEELSDYMHNEWMNGRFGYAASFLCGNIVEAAQMMQYIPSEEDLKESEKRNLAKTGLLSFRECLDSQEGRNFYKQQLS